MYQIPNLPIASELELETPAVLRALAGAHRKLAELKGAAKTIPNESILISTLGLQEAKDSSAIESIITTHDELYQTEGNEPSRQSLQAKEVRNYAAALWDGLSEVRASGLIRLSTVLRVQERIEKNNAGLRSQAGTTLKNQLTGETVYTPPQRKKEIEAALQNLLNFINDRDISALDPLVKLAVLHHQFESIHPFYDGNGRTGRILNLLYLVIEDLLDAPILYLSGSFIKRKQIYYELLQAVRDSGQWEPWILFVLECIEESSGDALQKILQMGELIHVYKHKLRSELPLIYSHELLNNLFKHPYTKIRFLEAECGITRQTASRYLSEMEGIGLVTRRKIGRTLFFINEPLVRILTN